MKIVIAGANGFLGRSLARHFADRGHAVIGLVRSPVNADHYRPVLWDGAVLGTWAAELEGAEALINLAGRSVNCRYHDRNRAAIFDSRLASTRILGDAVALCEEPPRVWINSSTATIYRHAEDGPQDEFEGEIGKGFSVEVAKAWEKAFFAARVPGTVRKVAVRSALVLAHEPGTVLAYLLGLARCGLGGAMGSGRQMVSWIHLDDFCRAVDWVIRHGQCDGVVNLASPGPVPNRDLMRAVRRAARVPFGIPSARWMLELGAFAMRTETELILKSRWVVPSRLTAHGFRFRWPSLPEAIEGLLLQRGDHPRRTTKKIAAAK